MNGNQSSLFSNSPRGTILEVQLADGGWLPLRYEARWVEDDGEGHAGLFPRWHLALGTTDGQADDTERPAE